MREARHTPKRTKQDGRPLAQVSPLTDNDTNKSRPSHHHDDIEALLLLPHAWGRVFLVRRGKRQGFRSEMDGCCDRRSPHIMRARAAHLTLPQSPPTPPHPAHYRTVGPRDGVPQPLVLRRAARELVQKSRLLVDLLPLRHRLLLGLVPLLCLGRRHAPRDGHAGGGGLEQ